jgi:hypothetical protein
MPAEALGELKALLLTAAGPGSPQRVAATRYTICRDVLLGSEFSSHLPGFLRQCLTIFRFKDFIHLYAPTQEERAQFLSDALRASETRAGLRSSYDAFNLGDF